MKKNYGLVPGKIVPNLKPNPGPNLQGGNPQTGVCNFKWDPMKAGTGIKISGNGKSIFLKESHYLFRSICADKACYKGLTYWEIWADKKTENELKIGVCTKSNFDMNTSFSDWDYGYAFYGLG